MASKASLEKFWGQSAKIGYIKLVQNLNGLRFPLRVNSAKYIARYLSQIGHNWQSLNPHNFTKNDHSRNIFSNLTSPRKKNLPSHKNSLFLLEKSEQIQKPSKSNCSHKLTFQPEFYRECIKSLWLFWETHMMETILCKLETVHQNFSLGYIIAPADFLGGGGGGADALF